MLSLNDFKLRPITSDDLDMVLRWRNSESVRRFMFNSHIITQKEHTDWFQRILNDSNCEWHIAEFRGKPIGVISITDIRRNDGTCTWGMYIDENVHNLGLGVVMEIIAIDRMVHYHKIRKISGKMLASNRRVMLMHKRFGFREEEVFEKHIRRADKDEVVVKIVLYTDKWPKIRNNIVSALKLREHNNSLNCCNRSRGAAKII